MKATKIGLSAEQVVKQLDAEKMMRGIKFWLMNILSIGASGQEMGL